MQIRQYSTADHDYVWRVHLLVISKLGVEATHKHYHDILHIEEEYLKSGGEFLVGIDPRGQVIAMGGLKRLTDGMAEIKRLRVHPDFQRRGYGAQLLRRLEERAVQLGFGSIYLDALTTQQYAHKLFQNHGYEIKGPSVIDGFDVLLFEKKLAM